MSLPKRNSADGRCYWMKPEVQEELQPLFDQCIQDAIDDKLRLIEVYEARKEEAKAELAELRGYVRAYERG